MSEHRKELEKAVGSAGKQIQALGKVIEKIAASLSPEDVAKAFAHLNASLHASHSRALLDLQIAATTSAEFSLDQPIAAPVTLAATPVAVTNVVVSPMKAGPALPQAGEHVDLSKLDGKAAAKALGGRLTRGQREEMKRLQSSVNIDDEDEDQTTAGEPEDGVDFIDD
jgi:hypothetical protein